MKFIDDFMEEVQKNPLTPKEYYLDTDERLLLSRLKNGPNEPWNVKEHNGLIYAIKRRDNKQQNYWHFEVWEVVDGVYEKLGSGKYRIPEFGDYDSSWERVLLFRDLQRM